MSTLPIQDPRLRGMMGIPPWPLSGPRGPQAAGPMNQGQTGGLGNILMQLLNSGLPAIGLAAADPRAGKAFLESRNERQQLEEQRSNTEFNQRLQQRQLTLEERRAQREEEAHRQKLQQAAQAIKTENFTLAERILGTVRRPLEETEIDELHEFVGLDIPREAIVGILDRANLIKRKETAEVEGLEAGTERTQAQTGLLGAQQTALEDDTRWNKFKRTLEASGELRLSGPDAVRDIAKRGGLDNLTDTEIVSFWERSQDLAEGRDAETNLTTQRGRLVGEQADQLGNEVTIPAEFFASVGLKSEPMVMSEPEAANVIQSIIQANAAKIRTLDPQEKLQFDEAIRMLGPLASLLTAQARNTGGGTSGLDLQGVQFINQSGPLWDRYETIINSRDLRQMAVLMTQPPEAGADHILKRLRTEFSPEEQEEFQRHVDALRQK